MNFIRTLAVVAAATGTASVAVPRPVQVAPSFSDPRTPSLNMSGMACAAPEGPRRLCLAVDDETDTAQWATLEGDRITPAGLVKLHPTSAVGPQRFEPRCGRGPSDKQEADGEAVAYSAPYWYVIGSHGCSRRKNEHDARAFRIYRVVRGAAASEASSTRVAEALRKLPETKDYAERCLEAGLTKKGKPICSDASPNGVTIEGLAAAPGLLMVGLRAPSSNGQALLLRFDPSTLFDAAGALSLPGVMRLPVGRGMGIRDLATLPDGRLVVLSGPAQSQSGSYRLHLMGRDHVLRTVQGWSRTTSNAKVKAETVVVVSAGAARAELLIMYDGLPDGGPELVDVDLPPTSP